MAFSGEKLKRLRVERGLSQRDMPVAHDTVSAIESGRRNPHPSTLRKLAAALDVEVSAFFDEPTVPLATAPAPPSPREWLADLRRQGVLSLNVETEDPGVVLDLGDLPDEDVADIARELRRADLGPHDLMVWTVLIKQGEETFRARARAWLLRPLSIHAPQLGT